MPTITNPFLSGGFAPVTTEHTVVDLDISGRLPDGLDGRFLRIGPNPVRPPDPSRYHWFTGDGMVHGLRLRDGQARWYRNRWVRSPGVAEALGEPAPVGPAGVETAWSPNTNVVVLGGRLHAVMEGGPAPVELTDELDTVGPSDLDGTLRGSFSGHPKLDPDTGETHVVAYWWGWEHHVAHVVVGPDGRVGHRRMVATTGSPMIHDAALTSRWVLVYDLPVAFDLDVALAGASLPYRWNDAYPSRIGLVPRAGGDVRWVEVDPCYVFHTLGAYDDGESVVADVVRWDRVFDGPGAGPESSSRSTLWRLRLDPTTGRSTAVQLDDLDQEFPRIDDRRATRRHRYGYAAVTLPHGGRGVARHDLDRGTRETFDFGPGAGANEAVFVARHDGADEGDGWLLTLVLDPERGASDLVVLDATALAEGPVARVHLPVRVPFGFHATWVPTTSDRPKG